MKYFIISDEKEIDPHKWQDEYVDLRKGFGAILLTSWNFHTNQVPTTLSWLSDVDSIPLHWCDPWE